MSETVTLSPEIKDMLTNVLASVPGAELPLVTMKLNEVLREFTRNSTAWRETICFDTQAGVQDYALAAPCPDAAIAWVHQVSTENRMLTLPTQPYGYMPSWGGPGAPQGAPRNYECPAPAVLRVVPSPDAVYPLVVNCSLTALSIYAPLPPGWVTLFHDALHDGVQSKLHIMPDKPFSNMKLAEYYGKRFREGIVDGTITASKSFAGGLQPTWPYPLPAGRITR